jgi:hypothetical protein
VVSPVLPRFDQLVPCALCLVPWGLGLCLVPSGLGLGAWGTLAPIGGACGTRAPSRADASSSPATARTRRARRRRRGSAAARIGRSLVAARPWPGPNRVRVRRVRGDRLLRMWPA